MNSETLSEVFHRRREDLPVLPLCDALRASGFASFDPRPRVLVIPPWVLVSRGGHVPRITEPTDVLLEFAVRGDMFNYRSNDTPPPPLPTTSEVHGHLHTSAELVGDTFSCKSSMHFHLCITCNQ